ncbi:hypothetical protein HMN09_00177700 [Mycena chlorophos]|uniref:Tc1-like transposase DDE domain-containing protein n=1 Tax=Mycena chlorophos TaxID=658473 RepID=A0A8H6TNM3_MYCCL|nr:hypothetical protein HMN09_00177700 [Mycena chlorophos]
MCTSVTRRVVAMPAISNRSKAATSRIHSRQTTQDAVDRTRDPDYEPEPTPSFISAEHEKKKRSLNADQLGARKRRREEADLHDPVSAPCKSKATLWREQTGATKKARDKNRQQSIAVLFGKKPEAAEHGKQPLGQLFSFWGKPPPADPPAPTPVSVSSSAPHASVDGTMAMEDVEIIHVPGPEPIEQPLSAVSDSDIEMPDPATMAPERAPPIERASPDVEIVEGPGENTTRSLEQTPDGPVSSELDDAEDDPTAVSIAAITSQHAALDAKIKKYEKTHCNKKKIAASVSDTKLADRIITINGLKVYNEQRLKLELQRVKLLGQLQTIPKPQRANLRLKLRKLKPSIAASRTVAAQFNKTTYWAQKLRSAAVILVRTGELPENKQGKGGKHATHFDDPGVKPRLQAFARKEVPVEEGGYEERISPQKLRRYVNEFLFPELEIDDTIGITTAVAWLKKLGYTARRYQKGVYYDGHERPDVVKARNEFIKFMENEVLPFSYQYEDVVDPVTGKKVIDPVTKLPQLREIAPKLNPGQKARYPIYHDETTLHANDQARITWERVDDHELRSKSRGRLIHESGFIIEHSGWLRLTDDEIRREELFPKRPLSPAEQALEDARKVAEAAAEAEKLRSGKGKGRKRAAPKEPVSQPATDRTTVGVDWVPPPPPAPFTRYRCDVYAANKTIYPGAGHDPWWDMPQLIAQTKNAVDIFEAKYPDGQAVFIFDCSSAHEAYASDALLAHKMNLKPGGKQPIMHATTIPGTTQRQSMVFEVGDTLPVDKEGKPQLELIGQPKGLERVLEERGLLAELRAAASARGGSVLKQCAECGRSEKAREAEAKARRELGDVAPGSEEVYDDDEERGSMCCMMRCLASQADFKAEKPLLQVLIEKRGHICLFLPKFHCELNPIEMVWAELKRYFRDHADGTFPKAKKLVPKGLDRISIDTIRRFFRHCNRYRSAYQLGLNPQQAAYAVKKYSSHRRVPREIMNDVNIINGP